jgi:redox-sensitive bicupin YhaK (pirin superfamily)
MGNVAVIRAGDIQVMSAGTGITHSEMNRRQDAPVKFLQIWLFPNRKQVEPRYGQIALNPADRHNRLAQILSPSPDDAGVWVHQDAWFHLGRFDAGASAEYAVRKPGNGVYCFVLSGRFEVAGTELGPRDGMGLWDLDAFNFTAVDADSEILLMDVPMAI